MMYLGEMCNLQLPVFIGNLMLLVDMQELLWYVAEGPGSPGMYDRRYVQSSVVQISSLERSGAGSECLSL